MRVGYIRGTTDEVIDRQKVVLQSIGVDKIYIDMQIGSKRQTELEKLLVELKQGDTLVVESLSRLTRSTPELMSMMAKLNKDGIEFISINGGMDTTKDLGKQIMKMFTTESAIEQEFLKNSQLRGIQYAKDNGKYTGKKKIRPDEKLFEMVYAGWIKKDGEVGKISTKEAMKMLGLKPNTFYRRVKEYRDSEIIDYGL